jgi:translation initiation factor IF-2
VNRNALVKVLREELEIFDGKLSSLKRFKDDVKEVQSGFECGIGIEGFEELEEGDILLFYVKEEKSRSI